MAINKSKHDMAINLIVFMLLFMSSSFIVTNNIISNNITIGLWIILFVFSLILSNMKINVHLLYSAIIISMLMLVTDFLCGENLVVTMKNIFAIVVVCLIGSAISFKEFSISYVKVMKFFCIVSLIGYSLHLIIPNLFNLFTSTYGSGTPYSNWILYIQYLGEGSSLYRNYGFTWEPGAFVTFICLAMLLDIFVVSNQLNIKSFLLYFVTIITTFSTTGIITMFCFYLYILFFYKKINKNGRIVMGVVFFISIVLVIVFNEMLFSTSNYTVFGKLILYLNSGGEKLSSVGIRINSITKVFQIFLKSPLYGWGYEGLKSQSFIYTKGINTCTFINWFAIYGLTFGCIMCYYTYLLCKRVSLGGINKIIVFMFLFGITSSENFARNSLFILLLFYGVVENFTGKSYKKFKFEK